MWNVKRASFLFRNSVFRPKFYTNGVMPCQNVDTIWQVVDRATTMPPKVFRQWNFVADFWLFLVEISVQKRQIWAILGIRKPETLGYPSMVKTASLCVQSLWQNIQLQLFVTAIHNKRMYIEYRSVIDGQTDGWTDRQICCSIYNSECKNTHTT